MHIEDIKKLPKIHLERLRSTTFSTTISYDFENDDDATFYLIRQIAYKYIAPIIISFGIVGNILTIVILRNPAFRGVTYNYFLTLAISDLLSMLFSISATIHMLNPTTSSHLTAVWYSYFETLLVNTAMATSVLIVVCITIDRYISVCRPHQFKVIHTNYYCRLSIVISLVTSFLIWFPTCFINKPELVKDCESFYDGEESNSSSLWVACQMFDPLLNNWYTYYSWVRETIISFIPIIIVIVLNGFLLKWFVDHQRQVLHRQNETYPHSAISSPRPVNDKHLITLLKAIISSFLITILPAGIFNAAYSTRLSTGLKLEIFRATANDLEILNHALNFYLYILLSKPIRKVLPSQFLKIKNVFVKNIFFLIKGGDSGNGGESERANSTLTSQSKVKVKVENEIEETVKIRQQNVRERTKQLPERDNKQKTLSQQTQLSDFESESSVNQADKSNENPDFSDIANRDSNDGIVGEFVKVVHNDVEINIIENVIQHIVSESG